jgi:phosphomannomutase
MKALSAVIFLGSILNSAYAQNEFLPGRIESRTAARTILAKCALKIEASIESCDGFQFYYSDSGLESDAKLISNHVYTEASLKELKMKPVLVNVFRESPGSYTLDSVEYLNDYEDSWGESTGAKVAYTAGRGVAYGVLVPISASLDVVGTVIGVPVSLVSTISKGISNSKINKLIKAIKSGEKINMDINRVYRLRDML